MTTIAPTPGQPRIRRFGDAAIQKAVDQALSGLTAGQSGAVVAYADGDKAGLAVAARLGEHWSIVGKLDKPWSGSVEAGAAVRFAW